MKKVAVSVHAHDNFSVDILKGLIGFDYIHLDIMDGRFVPTLNLNLDASRLIQSQYNIPIIAHLMVETPLKYIEPLIKSIHAILFHFEIKEDKQLIIDTIKSFQKVTGMVLNPQTPVEAIKEFLPLLDIILILGVEPGWSGQKFNKNVVKKVNKLAEWKKNDKEFDFLIDVDGGVNLNTAILLKNADILTSASAIFNSSDPNSIIKKLKEIA